MELKLERTFTCDNYTIGKLYIDDNYFSDTIEDSDRGLTQDMDIENIKDIKVYGKTAIPTGRYEVTLDVKSPKFSNFNKYKWAEIWDGYIPRLINVPGFDGILIHVANEAEDILGCIGVGQNTSKGRVSNSVITFNKLFDIMKPIKGTNEKIFINIIANYK